MKRKFLLITAACIGLCSCGSLSTLQTSSSSRQFQDGVYSSPYTRAAIREELKNKDKSTIKYFPNAETLEKRNSARISKDNSNTKTNIYIVGAGLAWFCDPFIYDPFWDPWYYDPWRWNGPWYWNRWSYRYWDPWFWDPWYGPYGPWGPYRPWGPYYPGWRPWDPYYPGGVWIYDNSIRQTPYTAQHAGRHQSAYGIPSASYSYGSGRSAGTGMGYHVGSGSSSSRSSAGGGTTTTYRRSSTSSSNRGSSGTSSKTVHNPYTQYSGYGNSSSYSGSSTTRSSYSGSRSYGGGSYSGGGYSGGGHSGGGSYSGGGGRGRH